MSKLPDGWARATIKELTGATGLFVDGDWVESKDQDPNGNIRLLQLADIGDGAFLDKSNRWINEDAFERLRCTALESGDVLVARMPDPLGRACLMPALEQRCVTVVDVAALRVDLRISDNRWAMHTVNSPQIRAEISVQSSGTTRKRISRGKLGEMEIPLPPKAEQTRIADQLDKLLARIQSCNDRIDAIPALLKRFRQAVLSAAIKRDLIGGGAPSGWRQCTVGDVLEGKPRNGYSPKAVVFETPVRSLTLSATTSGRFLAQHTKFIDEQIPEGSHLWLKPGDILIQRANTLEYVGVSAIFDGPSKQFIYPDLMMKCRPNQLILRKFLFYTLSAEETRQYFRNQATGTAGNMPKINQQTVMSAPMELPSLEEQEKIVQKIDALFKLADRIEARYKAARAHAQRITPLLLAKAFRGELVPQDPGDEPASDLLTRIRGLRDKSVMEKTRRNRKTPPATFEEIPC